MLIVVLKYDNNQQLMVTISPLLGINYEISRENSLYAPV